MPGLFLQPPHSPSWHQLLPILVPVPYFLQSYLTTRQFHACHFGFKTSMCSPFPGEYSPASLGHGPARSFILRIQDTVGQKWLNRSHFLWSNLQSLLLYLPSLLTTGNYKFRTVFFMLLNLPVKLLFFFREISPLKLFHGPLESAVPFLCAPSASLPHCCSRTFDVHRTVCFPTWLFCFLQAHSSGAPWTELCGLSMLNTLLTLHIFTELGFAGLNDFVWVPSGVLWRLLCEQQHPFCFVWPHGLVGWFISPDLLHNLVSILWMEIQFENYFMSII